MVRFEIGNRRLVAGGWMTLLALTGVLLFAQLGRWQWHRAAEKRLIAAAFTASTAAAATDLGTRSTADLARYARVRASGRYESAHQFLLDNMSHSGQTGYEVLTPLRLDDGRVLLVNRGWVPWPNHRRDQLPDVTLATAGHLTIGGRLDDLPVTGLSAGRAAPSEDAHWPKRTSFPTAPQLGAALREGTMPAQKVEPRQLLLDASEPQGFARDWRSASAGFGPERHLSYAVQWWGLGALTLFLYLFMNLERRPL